MRMLMYVILSTCGLTLHGQVSFQITPINTNYSSHDINYSPEGSISVLNIGPVGGSLSHTNIYLSKLFPQLNKGNGYLINYDNERFGSLSTIHYQKNNFFIPLYANGDFRVFNLNENTSDTWTRRRRFSRNGTISTFEKKIAVVTSPSNVSINNSIVCYFLESSSGKTINRKGWTIELPLDKAIDEILVRSIKPTKNNSLVVFGELRDMDRTINDSFIMEIDTSNSLKNFFRILDYNFKTDKINVQDIQEAPDKSIFLIGSTSNHSTITQNSKDLVLACFDEDLNIKWTKVFFAENFDFRTASLNFEKNGNIIFSYSTNGAFPTIFAKLNPDGEILSEIGYALYSPRVEVTPNGSLLLSTQFNFDETGDVSFKRIIALTDSLGNIEGCENYQAKLRSIDVSLAIDSLQYDTFSIPDLEWDTAQIESFEYDLEDFCDFPPPPHPNFHLPDTLCLGNCLSTDSTNNANAHGVEWNLEGDNLQLKVEDSLQFNFCPTEIGTYTLRQTIWFLGVDYSFEKIVEIVPPLEVSLPNDTLFCDAPAMIELTSNRPLQNIEWSSGETTSTALIYESGEYDVEADDGYCQANTSANYEFIFDKIDTTLALQMPDSATVCAIKLPFELRPESEYISLFQKENELVDSVLTFSQSGVYRIKTTIDGCEFSKAFQLKTSECAANIYVPSAFSPNDDGINDSFLPLGSDIQPIRLKIYDRWGGKLFESTETQIAWNGKFNEKSAQQGVYVFQFEYVNLLTGLEEELSGEVTVMR